MRKIDILMPGVENLTKSWSIRNDHHLINFFSFLLIFSFVLPLE